MTDTHRPDEHDETSADAAKSADSSGRDDELLDDILGLAAAGTEEPQSPPPARCAEPIVRVRGDEAQSAGADEPEIDDALEPPPIAEVGIEALLPPFALAGLLFYLFRENLGWLVRTWRDDEYYTHGFLIPLLTAYIIYRKAGSLATLPRSGYAWSIAILVPTICVHFVAIYLDVNFATSFALIGWLIGLVCLLWGWPVLTHLLFPLAFLGFMVPMGKLLIDQVAQPMQVLGARMAGVAAQALGMPLRIDGVSLETPGYTFEVAVACSGLKSAIAMLALGALLAYLVKAPIWKKLLIFASSLPVAILANATRIWMTVILGTALGHEAAEGFFHTASGLLVFVLAFLGLFGVTVLLRCRRLRDDI